MPTRMKISFCIEGDGQGDTSMRIVLSKT